MNEGTIPENGIDGTHTGHTKGAGEAGDHRGDKVDLVPPDPVLVNVLVRIWLEAQRCDEGSRMVRNAEGQAPRGHKLRKRGKTKC